MRYAMVRSGFLIFISVLVVAGLGARGDQHPIGGRDTGAVSRPASSVGAWEAASGPVVTAPQVLAVALGASSRGASPDGETEPPAVTGLFTEPRPRAADDIRALGEPPPSPFRPWDGVSTVVYDTRTLMETDLGPGEIGRFSPDSTRMVWATTADGPGAPTEVRLLDLETMRWQALAPGRAPRFLDDDHVIFFAPGANRRTIVDLHSGDQREAQPVEAPDFPDPVTPEGLVIRLTPIGPEPYPFLRNSVELIEPGSGRTVLSFEASMARPAGPGELVVATPPQDGSTNIFIVEITSGEARFIATSRYTPPNWPLAAGERVVLWTEDFCGQPPGRMRLYDRQSGTLTELDRSDWVTLTPDGLIAASPFGFGARWLVDPTTFSSIVTIPERAADARPGSAGDVAWSPDYRYASHGFAGGHGGLC